MLLIQMWKIRGMSSVHNQFWGVSGPQAGMEEQSD